MTDEDERSPEDQAADDRIRRQGFNPLLAVLVIVLIGAAVYFLSALLP